MHLASVTWLYLSQGTQESNLNTRRNVALVSSTDWPEVLDLVAKLAQQLIREQLLKKERRWHHVGNPKGIGRLV